MTSAEQFLAKQGIKFRAVPSERGPGEWNVTLSRKGGGRLKLNYNELSTKPTLLIIIDFMVIERPTLEDYDNEADYYADCAESSRVKNFFTVPEIQELLHLQCELTG